MTKKKLQNLLLASLLCASVISFVSVEYIEAYQTPIVAELKQSDIPMKFQYINQLAELVKEVVLPTF